MNIAICEDDSVSRQFEKQLVEKWAENNSQQINIDLFTCSENFLFESEDRQEYDLLLLDIQMKEMNGVELARLLRKRGFKGSLIFLTGVKDYAIEGYEVGAVRYILKPVSEQKLFPVLDLIREELSRKHQEFFMLKQENDAVKIPLDDIVYIEARGHYVHMVTEAKPEKNAGMKKQYVEKEWKGVFSEVAKQFDEKQFFCLRRGLLVNLQHVLKISRTECYIDNEEVMPVSRNCYKELNEAFIAFYRNDNGN